MASCPTLCVDSVGTIVACVARGCGGLLTSGAVVWLVFEWGSSVE